jgi:hypothetical protein
VPDVEAPAFGAKEGGLEQWNGASDGVPAEDDIERRNKDAMSDDGEDQSYEFLTRLGHSCTQRCMSMRTPPIDTSITLGMVSGHDIGARLKALVLPYGA